MATTARNLFDVDPAGLAKLLEHRGKGFAVVELVSNAWDTNAKRVEVTLEPVPGKALASLVVEDDDPEGFADLRHAYTLFAESARKSDPTTRGRFNLGEKLVIVLCDEAEIATTKGTLMFDSHGRSASRACRASGSRFTGTMRMTREELSDAVALLRRLVVPAGVTFVLNGEVLGRRSPVAVFTASLPTVLSDSDGNLRPTERVTTVSVYEPVGVPSLYELGVPVVETGDRYDVDVAQKVPLNMERDNVTPAYLRRVRTAVLNHTFSDVTPESAGEAWVSAALADKDVSPEAVEAVVRARFGDRAVIFDPSDLEGTKIAASQGYTVVPPGAFNRDQWARVKDAGALVPAGRVTPSPSKGLNNPDGSPLDVVPESKWTPGEVRVAAYTRALGEVLLGFVPTVRVCSSVTYPAAATWCNRTITFNRGRLGHRWFDVIGPPVDALILHEFAHHRVHDHLSADYADEVARLAGLFVEAVLRMDDEHPLMVARSAASGALAEVGA